MRVKTLSDQAQAVLSMSARVEVVVLISVQKKAMTHLQAVHLPVALCASTADGAKERTTPLFCFLLCQTLPLDCIVDLEIADTATLACG